MTAPGRWLWVTAEITAYPTTGGLVYSMEMASAVARAGALVTMIGLGDDADSDRLRPIALRPVAGSLRGGARSVLSPLPNQAFACAIPEFERELGLALNEPWDVVVLDSLRSAWCVDIVERRHRGAVVFITQNHDATVRRRVAAEASLWSGRRVMLTLDRWKVERLERRATVLADVITSITDDDRELFEVDAPGKSHLVLRPGWSGQVAPASPVGQRPRRVGIVGSFDWHVKQENLRRFLIAADPIFADAGVELVVGGRVPESFSSEFEGRLHATTFLGWVDDLGAVLSECRIGVISEPLGGGFKMKSLDYVFNGVPIASLSGAAAGLPLNTGVDLIVAPDERALAVAIVSVIEDAPRLEAMAMSAIDSCSTDVLVGRRRRCARRLGRVAPHPTLIRIRAVVGGLKASVPQDLLKFPYHNDDEQWAGCHLTGDRPHATTDCSSPDPYVSWYRSPSQRGFSLPFQQARPPQRRGWERRWGCTQVSMLALDSTPSNRS